MFIIQLIIGRLRHAILPVIVVAVVVVLSGCQTQTEPMLLNPDDLYDPSVHSSYYVANLQQSRGESCNIWRLLAARALLKEGQSAAASLQLQALSRPATPMQQQEAQLLTAEIALGTLEPLAAQPLLAQLTASQLSVGQQQRYYQMQQTLARMQQDPINELRALMALRPLLPRSAQTSNREQTWQLLLTLSPACQASINPSSSHADILQGWLTLLKAYQDNQRDHGKLQVAIAHWQARHPGHPAADCLPEVITQHLSLRPLSLSKVGLLLPLSGKAALFGQSVRQGFLDAARQAALPAINRQVPSLLDPSINELTGTDLLDIVVYDSAAQPLHVVINQAKKDKISLLVGPLLKQDVEQLGGLKTPFPVLALNIPVRPQKHLQRCYYGLSPKNEAQEAARHLWHQRKRHPLILVPQGYWGEQVARDFQETWQQLAGDPASVHHFSAIPRLKQFINRWSGSLVEAAQAVDGPIDKQKLGSTEEQNAVKQSPGVIWSEYFNINSSEAVDAVYMIVTPEEFILLKSIIDMATDEGAKRPALYASSRCFQSTIGPDLRLEMEGLQFSDVPLLITQQQAGQRAAKLFNNDYSLIRLYAMGSDAWLLANHFVEVTQLSGFKLPGATGILQADPQRIIHRQLPWVRYHRGKLVVVP